MDNVKVVNRYRRRADALTVEAMQYSTDVTPAQVASFVLGVDVDHTTIENEKILDIVEPLFDEWNQKSGNYPLHVIEPAGKLKLRLNTNDWMVRWKHQGPMAYDKGLLFVKPANFLSEYAVISSDSAAAAELALSDLIKDAFTGTQIYTISDATVFSERLAEKIIKAGWNRKEQT